MNAYKTNGMIIIPSVVLEFPDRFLFLANLLFKELNKSSGLDSVTLPSISDLLILEDARVDGSGEAAIFCRLVFTVSYFICFMIRR